VVALFPCLLTIYATGMVVLVWALFGAVSAFGSMGANIVVYAAVFCYMSIVLAFVTSAVRDVIPYFARVPEDVYFAFKQFVSYVRGKGGHFQYPVGSCLIFASRPKTEINGCDVTLGESFLVLPFHACQYFLFRDVPWDVVHDHPGVFSLCCAGVQAGLF
jgi:hypothetical protein